MTCFDIQTKEFIEVLAHLEHERWSHWQKYLHSKCIKNKDGSLTIPADLVTRWEEQMHTSYNDLNDSEKQSDRNFIINDLPKILSAIALIEHR